MAVPLRPGRGAAPLHSRGTRTRWGADGACRARARHGSIGGQLRAGDPHRLRGARRAARVRRRARAARLVGRARAYGRVEGELSQARRGRGRSAADRRSAAARRPAARPLAGTRGRHAAGDRHAQRGLRPDGRGCAARRRARVGAAPGRGPRAPARRARRGGPHVLPRPARADRGRGRVRHRPGCRAPRRGNRARDRRSRTDGPAVPDARDAKQAALLLCDALLGEARAAPEAQGVVAHERVVALVRGLAAEHHAHWQRDPTDPAVVAALAADAVATLVALDLVAPDPSGALRLRPLAHRFRDPELRRASEATS